MIVSWLLIAVVISLGLSVCAVFWDTAAGVAQKNERTRIWVRRVLLLEATSDFTDQIVSFAELIASAPSKFRAFLVENAGLFVVAGVAIIEVLWFGHHILHHAETPGSRVRDIVAIVVGVAAFALAVFRIFASSDTRKI